MAKRLSAGDRKLSESLKRFHTTVGENRRVWVKTMFKGARGVFRGFGGYYRSVGEKYIIWMG